MASVACSAGYMIRAYSTPIIVIGIIALLNFGSCAHAKDVALILDEPAQRDLIQVLDTAAKAQGVAIATQVSHILEKLKVAPIITERTEPTPDKTESPK